MADLCLESAALHLMHYTAGREEDWPVLPLLLLLIASLISPHSCLPAPAADATSECRKNAGTGAAILIKP